MFFIEHIFNLFVITTKPRFIKAMNKYSHNFTNQESNLNNNLKDLTKNGLSLIYNSMHLGNVCYQQNIYLQTLSSILYKYKVYGYITQQEMNIVKQCNCINRYYKKQTTKYGFKTIMNLISLSLNLIIWSTKTNR